MLVQAILLDFFQLIGIHHVGCPLIFASSFIVSACEFIFFVAGKPILFDIFIGQLILGRSFSVFARNIGRVKYLSHWVARRLLQSHNSVLGIWRLDHNINN